MLRKYSGVKRVFRCKREYSGVNGMFRCKGSVQV